MIGTVRHIIKASLSYRKPKIFCIGRNKTGTTSLAKALSDLGFYVAPQKPAELLLRDWYNGNINRIIRFVKYNGQAFQDIPFSLPETYKYLDSHFPNSKFILTVRDSSEDWYNSLLRFHSKVFGNGKIPTKEVLQKANYVYQGWAWEANRFIYTCSEEDPYNKEILISHYQSHNNQVVEYFRDRANQLLVLNLKDSAASEKLSNFLDTKKTLVEIPWLNKTQN